MHPGASSIADRKARAANVRGASDVIAFEMDVEGVPRPQGSLKAFKRGARVVLTTTTKGLYAWRAAIGWEAKRLMAGRLPTRHRPMHVRAVFRFAPPKASRRDWPIVRPDLDKLLRGLLDSLTGVVWYDDAVVVECKVQKRYTDEGERPGVWVSVGCFATYEDVKG